ncbi:hypothetical protein M2404_003881 [Rheinheimera pacifica]|uniref:hypothetical protein n=1 Tax=Rheinheimera pacifica TaxID=173990 RepID=UPI0021688A31|nr:hypothetical protein [Rheinheimera pacifica]MCS4309509.1 hypothetical protein [Rheinheimera pacifica]
MSAPQLASLNRSNLKLHRRLNPAKFERVFQIGDDYYRYYSDEAGFCIAQYIADQMHRAEESWVYLQSLGGDSWCFISGTKNTVKSAAFSNISDIKRDFDYDFVTAETIFLTPESVEELQIEGPIDFDYQEIRAVFNGAVPDKYKLIDLQAVKLKLTVVTALVGAVVLGLWWFTSQKTDTPSAQQYDPWLEWRNSTVIDAHSTLEALVRITSLGYTLPNDWRIGPIVLTEADQSLVVPIIAAETNGRYETLKNWVQDNSNLSPIVSAEQKQFALPIHHESRSHTNVIYRLGIYQEVLHDDFLALGAQSVNLMDLGYLSGVRRWQLEALWTDVDFSIMQVLAEMVKARPVYMKSLSIEQGQNEGVLSTLRMEIIIEGVE